MDAGTDNGFTFTSPNWETLPRWVISLSKVSMVSTHFMLIIVAQAIHAWVLSINLHLNKQSNIL